MLIKGEIEMDIRKKKWLTYFITFCMTLSVLTGMEPTSFLVYAEIGPHKPVMTKETVTFSITKPRAYAVYLAGELNEWKEKDPAFKLSQQEEDLWEITLDRSEYEKLAQTKNTYKFVTYTEENGTAYWKEGANHEAYCEGFELINKNLNVKKVRVPSYQVGYIMMKKHKKRKKLL